MNAPQFVIEEHSVSDECMIEIRGEADLSNAPAIRAALERAFAGGATRIFIDLSALTFMDSTVAAAFFWTKSRVRAMGGTMTVLCPAQPIRRIFELTALDSIIGLHDDRQEALRAFRPEGSQSGD